MNLAFVPRVSIATLVKVIPAGIAQPEINSHTKRVKVNSV